jgi:hypothetical protein
MKTIFKKTATIATISALLLSVGYAQAGTALPPIHHIGQVEYLSGGIGQDEAKAIEVNSKQWPLTLEFVVKNKQRAEYTADVRVVINDAKGHAALKTTTDGPFLLAKLAPGRYAVDAKMGGKTLHKSLEVAADHATKAIFEWPQGTGERT